jgi:hypothetical protein
MKNERFFRQVFVGLFVMALVTVFVPYVSKAYDLGQSTTDGLGKIYFIGNEDIYAWDLDNGDQPVNLTNSPEMESELALSKDGTKIVFVRDGEIWVMDLEDSYQYSLGIKGASPVWSADGTKIAYLDEEMNISLMDAYGCLIDTCYWREGTVEIAWSLGIDLILTQLQSEWPDKQYHAIKTLKDPMSDEEGTLIVKAGKLPPMPQWSPDLTQVVFCDTNEQGTLSSIKVASLNFPEPKTLITIDDPNMSSDYSSNEDKAKTLHDPVWLTDGQWIAYVLEEGCNSVGIAPGEIWVVSADGSENFRLGDFRGMKIKSLCWDEFTEIGNVNGNSNEFAEITTRSLQAKETQNPIKNFKVAVSGNTVKVSWEVTKYSTCTRIHAWWNQGGKKHTLYSPCRKGKGTFKETFKNVPPGTYYCKIHARVNGKNYYSSSKELIVKNSGGNPPDPPGNRDLVISGLTPGAFIVEISNPYVRSSACNLTVGVTIKNAGKADVTKPFDVTLFSGGREDKKYINYLAAGKTTDVKLAVSFPATRGAVIPFVVHVDYDNAISESNENNNREGSSVRAW